MSVRTICAKANAQSLVALRIPRGQSLAENVALEERPRGQGKSSANRSKPHSKFDEPQMPARVNRRQSQRLTV